MVSGRIPYGRNPGFLERTSLEHEHKALERRNMNVLLLVPVIIIPHFLPRPWI
jgi:hypothetical protein